MGKAHEDEGEETVQMAGTAETLNEGMGVLPSLPRPTSASKDAFPRKVAFVGAMGFEPRSKATLSKLREFGVVVDAAILVRYNPPSGPNLEDTIMNLARTICRTEPKVVDFDRFSASSYLALEAGWNAVEDSGSDILIDLSGMSKFLILSMLWAARNTQRRVLLAYFEPSVYHPTEAEYENMVISKGSIGPFVIKGGVSNILTSPWLSSVRFDERPVLFVGFPGFDAEILTDPIEEFAPESLFLIEPGADSEKWTRHAIRKLNSEVYNSSSFIRREIGQTQIHDYLDTFITLEGLYRSRCLTHRIVVSPTGSKLQTVGSFFFKIVHPDVELVYPTPAGYNTQAAEGIGPGFIIDFGVYRNVLETLKEVRRSKVTNLLNSLNKRLGPG